jgi:hypothetical protein
MKRYKNLSGDSGVLAYETGEDYIKIKLRDGDVYLYNYYCPGKDKVERMKELAAEGRGLSTFISRYVRERYTEKLE